MPMTETEFGLAKDRLVRVATGQPRRFCIAGKSSDRAMWIRIAQSASQPMSQVEQPFRSGFQWRVTGLVHKLQGKYVFMEEDSYGAVSEGKLVRAINQQLKNGGEHWGGRDKKISPLPAVWMPKSQAEAFTESLPTATDGNEDYVETDKEPETTPVVETSTDPFDSYVDAFGVAQAALFESSEQLHKDIQKLAIVLTATKDEFLVEVAKKNLPEYLQDKRGELLKQVVKVGICAPKDRVGEVAKILEQVKAEEKILKDKAAEIEAMEKHQPPQGHALSFDAYRTALEGLKAFCALIATKSVEESWSFT